MIKYILPLLFCASCATTPAPNTECRQPPQKYLEVLNLYKCCQVDYDLTLCSYFYKNDEIKCMAVLKRKGCVNHWRNIFFQCKVL